VASFADNILAIRDNLAATLATETAYQVLNGAKPSYTSGGKQVQWTEYVRDMTATIAQLTQLAAAATPWEFVTRGYG
jgi:hypothetical protein